MEKQNKTNNAPHILKAIASGFVWGLGQLFNKQFIKSIFFFLFMVILVTIELMSGSYFTEYNPYADLNRFEGGTIEDGSAEYGFSDSFSDYALYKNGLKNYEPFKEYYEEYKKTNSTFDMAELVSYTAKDLKVNNPESFTDVLDYDQTNKYTSSNTFLQYESAKEVTGADEDYSNYQVLDIASKSEAVVIPSTEVIYVSKTTGKIYYEVKVGFGGNTVSYYDAADGSERKTIKELFGYDTISEGIYTYYTKDDGATKYEKRIISTGTLATSSSYEFINVNDPEDKIVESDFYNCYSFTKQRNFFANATSLYIEITNTYDKNQKYYLNLMNYNPNVFPIDADGNLSSSEIVNESTGLHSVTIKNTLYLYNGKIYEYFNPRVNGYRQTNFSKELTKAINKQINDSIVGSSYAKSDYTKFLLRIYFEMNPDVKEDFETRFNNFFNDRAGFFVKGIWSCITLGETDREEYTAQLKVYDAIPVTQGGSTKFIMDNVPIQGHTSTYLLINGIISVLVLVFFVIVWVWNIKDAYKTSKTYAETHERVSSKEYFKTVYEGAFEYIVLLPAIIVVAFISIMPIIFSFLIAFTNYKSNIRLIDWVGLENFVSIFSFGKSGDISIPYGTVFWKVLGWTIVWAVCSTVTVFFGGFFQAMIINNTRVPFKKFWRTILILPWAIPSLISQMMFSIIFQESGIINEILRDIGAYDLFKEIGILGIPYNEYTNSFLQSLYLGYEDIQWFTNPYNKWFVRITLIVVNIWLGFPYYMALMSGIMTSIDKTLYEAAEIDGATKGQQFRKITFPLVMYSTAPLLVMAFSGNFNNFGMIYFVTSGGAHQGDIATAYAGDTDILISWMYSLTTDEKIYNMASVFSILIFIVIGSIAAWNYSQTKAFKED